MKCVNIKCGNCDPLWEKGCTKLSVINIQDCERVVVEDEKDPHGFDQHEPGVMTSERFNVLLEDTLNSIQNVLGSKAREYAQGGDRLFNFRVAASINNTTMQAALWGMATKHLVSVMDLINGRLDVRRDVIEEKIGDLINYLILLKAVLYEQKGV